MKFSGDWIFQMYINFGGTTTTQTIYWRTKYNGTTWLAWQTLATGA